MKFKPLRCAVLAVCLLLPAFTAVAQYVPEFYNNSYYNSQQNIDATNFYNDYGGVFSVTPATGTGWQQDLYQSWFSTCNFTNFGEMDSETGFYFVQQFIPGAGKTQAGTVFNAGNINCGTNDLFFFITGNGLFIPVGGFGGIQVWATNIYNSGSINLGADGLGRFYANNVTFFNGTLDMENAFLNLLGQTNTGSISATGSTGLNTNLWEPDVELQPTFAQSSPPLNFTIFNSTPYFKEDFLSPTNVVVRMVFIQNIDTNNVNYNVYFGNAVAFNNGSATIEWLGSYTDPVGGGVASNYLYLNDDYVYGSSTNILSYNAAFGAGPANFVFAEQSTPEQGLGTPVASSYPNIGGYGGPFPPGVKTGTNIYSYVNAALTASTVSTNSVYGGAVTNLSGRFEITASNELSLTSAEIYGMNYLLLNSTNNFDNDGSSTITSPYTDVYLGRTNNSMVVSNLLVSVIPFWNGTVQGWNTRWFYTDTNSGITYDYRALLVSANVQPVNNSLQQDVKFYSSNNVAIYDTLNIFRYFYTSCTNLLLAYNGAGAGVASVDGELNLSSPTLFWANATPRLCNLTNNGAIRTATLANFGNASQRYNAWVNTGVISNVGCVIYSADVENSGQVTEQGSFETHSLTETLSENGITATGAFTNVCSSLVITNTTLAIGNGLSITATNLLTDYGTTSNFWSLGSGNSGQGVASGLALPIKPASGDLLGTTITNIGTSGTLVKEYWAGQDRGAVNAGFANNAALGLVTFDALGSNARTNFFFYGTGVSNAMYIDCIVLADSATNTDSSGNYLAFGFNTNLVVYYAQALENNESIAEKLNHKNGNHFRWVPSYVGLFSSTNVVGPAGATNLENDALTVSPDIDSDGDGVNNLYDSTPFFVPQMINFTIGTTSTPPSVVQLTWQTPPLATNYVYYTTNLLQPWQPFNAFGSYYWNTNPTLAVTNSAHTNWFISPQGYGNQATNVWIFDNLTNMPHFYQIVVQPNLLFMP
ncbi:MAG TPA: hypothetical protein VK742_16910 [Candidatus Sulfotelmatobacter sp.]|nr:hypothetical protein [Candidatus Sulfotelmatobacter sp.]